MKAYLFVFYKPEVPDPEEKALLSQIREAGYPVNGLRRGKYFILTLADMNFTKAELVLDEIGKKLLANPVTERFYYEFDLQEVEKQKVEMLMQINVLATKYGLRAEFVGDIRSVGVQGDARTYTPAVVLIGPYPGDEQLDELSRKIWNGVNVNRVTFDITNGV